MRAAVKSVFSLQDASILSHAAVQQNDSLREEFIIVSAVFGAFVVVWLLVLTLCLIVLRCLDKKKIESL